jgi:hypothetical protein
MTPRMKKNSINWKLYSTVFQILNPNNFSSDIFYSNLTQSHYILTLYEIATNVYTI